MAKFWKNSIFKPQKINFWSFIKKALSFQWFGYQIPCKCNKTFNTLKGGGLQLPRLSPPGCATARINLSHSSGVQEPPAKKLIFSGILKCSGTTGKKLQKLKILSSHIETFSNRLELFSLNFQPNSWKNFFRSTWN